MIYKTIKIPEFTYDAIKRAQTILAQEGLGCIPNNIIDKCTIEIDKINISTVVDLAIASFREKLRIKSEES